MAILATALYILAVACVRKNNRDIIYRHAADSKLGGITQAGVYRDSWGYRPADPEHNLRVLGCYQTVYLFEGSGRFFDATGRNVPLRAGDLILTFPRLGACYGPGPDERWSEVYIQFQGPVFDVWRKRGLLDPSRPILHLEPVELWRRRFETLLDELRQPACASPLVEVCRLQELLAEILLGEESAAASARDVAWASKACALLESDLGRELALHDLAAKLGTTPDGFRKRFTRLVGMPPAKFRTARTMDRACELMHQKSLSSRKVAEMLGFSDEFHFSRRFKQVTGSSPSTFRQNLPKTR